MVNALNSVDGSILDCKKSIEEFDNSLLSLHTEIFNRIQEQFSNLNSEISNILDLFDEFDVSDDKGIWSKEAIAQLGLLSQKYELAQYQVQQYNNEIDELNKQYLAGRYSATEYADKLAELNSAQWDSVKASESAKDSIMELNEVRVENAIKGIEKEIESYKELTESQIKALNASKDLHAYEKSISEKTKSLDNIDHQISAVQNDTSASGIARLKRLQDERRKAAEELSELEYNHSIEVSEEALNKQFEDYEENRQQEITNLKASLNDRETILAESFNTVKANASLVGQEIATIATEHGIMVSNSLISSWQSGERAIASYGEILSQNTSAFIGNIMGVENEIWNLQAQANLTSDSLAWMFSTKADSLVNELTTSYYSEMNLQQMTQSLHDSLVNTLERGYDVSKIVNALNSIKTAADSASDSIKKVGSENSKNSTANNANKFSGGGGGSLKAEAYTALQYAKGTRSSKGNVIITDEKGYEIKLPKLSSGNYTIANEGTQVFTKEQTDNLFEWSKFTPNPSLMNKRIPDAQMAELQRITRMPDIVSSQGIKNSTPVTIGSLINVHGNIDKSNVKQMESIANQAVDRLVKQLNDGVKYGK